MLLAHYLFFLCPLYSSLWTAVSTVIKWCFSSFDFIFWIQCWRPCLPRVTRVVARLRPRTEKRRRVVTDLRDRMQRASLRLDGHCPALPPAGQLWCEPHVFWRQAGVWTIGIFLSLAPPAMRDELLTSHPSVFPRDDVPAMLSQRYHARRLAVGRKVNELRTLWRLFSLVTAGPSQSQNICTHSDHSKLFYAFELAASNQGNRWWGISRINCGDFNKLMPSRKDFFSELGILVKSWKSILHKSLLPAWTNPYCQCGQILSTPPLSCGQLPHPS